MNVLAVPIASAVFLAGTCLVEPDSHHEHFTRSSDDPKVKLDPSGKPEKGHADFFELHGFQGRSIRFKANYELADADKLQYSCGHDLDHRVGSVVTGSRTWVILWSDERFKGSFVKIGPNRSVNLRSLNGFHRRVESFQVFKKKPSCW